MWKRILAGLFASLLLAVALPACTPATGGGGTLNLYATDPSTLDPAVANESNSGQFVGYIFSGLVKIDDRLQVVPDIAANWSISEDGKVYTFNLRKDVHFQDGRPVKASDFKYSWERAANPATASEPVEAYLGDIAGVRESVAGKASGVSGLRVADDYTLEVTLVAPRSYFLGKLAFPTSYVVDQNNVKKGKDWWKSPNGTGPFRLKSWKENSSLVLERNGLYYGQKASLEQVTFKLYAGLPMDLYETGDIDIATVSLPWIERATDPADPISKELTVVPELSVYYLDFNLSRAPFNDANIRKAFAMAVDKEKIARLVFKGMVAPSNGILPPGLPGFDAAFKGVQFDPAQAKELIKKSEYGDVSHLPEITLTTFGEGGSISKYLEAVISQWRENLGVDVEVRQIGTDRFVFHLEEEANEIIDGSWIADYPSPASFLEPLFQTGAQYNYGKYRSPAFDGLLRQAAAEPDGQKALEFYRLAQETVANDAACLPLFSGKAYMLVKPYVTGYAVNALGLVRLENVAVKAH